MTERHFSYLASLVFAISMSWKLGSLLSGWDLFCMGALSVEVVPVLLNQTQEQYYAEMMFVIGSNSGWKGQLMTIHDLRLRFGLENDWKTFYLLATYPATVAFAISMSWKVWSLLIGWDLFCMGALSVEVVPVLLNQTQEQYYAEMMFVIGSNSGWKGQLMTIHDLRLRFGLENDWKTFYLLATYPATVAFAISMSWKVGSLLIGWDLFCTWALSVEVVTVLW